MPGKTQVAEEKRLFADWLDGQSLRQIACRFGMSRMAVCRLARKHRWVERREKLKRVAENRIASEYEQLAIRLCRTHALFAELHERLVQEVEKHFQTLVEKEDAREVVKFCRGRTVQYLLGDHAELLEAFTKLFGRTDRVLEQALELRRPMQSLGPQKGVGDQAQDQGGFPPNLGLTPEQFNEFARFIVERQQQARNESDRFLCEKDSACEEVELESEGAGACSVAFV